MRRFFIFLLLASLLAPMASAGPGKPWYKNKWWWAGVAVIGAGIAADSLSTARVRDACPGCTEQNRLLGKHPSNKRLAAVELVGFGIQTSLHAALCHYECDDTKPYRVLAYTLVPGIVGGLGLHNARHNYGLLRHKPGCTQDCSLP